MNLSFPSPYQPFFVNDQSQKSQNSQIVIRSYFFDHFIFPPPSKLTLLTLTNIFSNLDSKITIDQFADIACKHLPSITREDAEIYCIMHQLAQKDVSVDFIKSLFHRKKVYVDSRSLCLFLYLQLYAQQHRQSLSFENKLKDVNVGTTQFQERSAGKQNAGLGGFSPLNSPRAKTIRVQSQTNEIQQIQYYLKNNIKTMLKLITTQFNDNDDVQITAQEYNLLSIIFSNENKKQLSTQSIFEKDNKVSISLLADWIIKNTGTQESETHLISGFTKSVTIKPFNSLQTGDVKIVQCEDSHIFIDHPIKTLQITQCSNCQIFVSAVSLITTISFCEKVNVCLATNFLRISNTIDSTINYYGSFAPVIYGDSRNITLGPHNGNTLRLLDRLRETKIPICKENTIKYLKPIIMHGNQNIDWTTMEKEEFNKMILPEEQFGAIDYPLVEEHQFDLEKMGKDINDKKILSQPISQEKKIILPILAPIDFMKCQFDRYKLFSNLQAQIKQAGLKEDDQKLLQQAIQGNFREWLMNTGSIKPITDLVKLIDQENN